MIKGILFDWDGTIVETLPIWINVYRQKLTDVGYQRKLSDQDIIALALTGNFPYDDLPQNVFSKEFLYDLFAAGKEKLPEAPLYPGVDEMLKKFADLPKVITTGSSKHIVQETIRNLNLTDTFDLVLGEEDVKQNKPDPEIIYKAVGFLQVNPENLILVGDLPKDVQAAKTAGVKTALYYPPQNARYYDKQKLLEPKPDFIVHSWDEFTKLVFGMME